MATAVRTATVQASPAHVHGTTRRAPLDPSERLRLVLVLRPGGGARSPGAGASSAIPGTRRRKLGRHDLSLTDGCDPLDLAKVVTFAADHRLSVVRFEPACRHLILEGAVADVERTFGVTLHWRDHGDRLAHTHEESVRVPHELAQIVAHVLGLADVPIRRPSSLREERSDAVRRKSHGRPIPPTELVRHYRYPRSALGRGQRIAIIALGGGFHPSDLRSYCRDVLGLDRMPVVRAISVDGATNSPLARKKLGAVMRAYNDPANSLADLRAKFPDTLGPAIATVETTMDVQLAVAAAPEAEIDVYFAPGSPMGFYDVVHAICGLHEALDEQGRPYAPGPPHVISLSWSQPEGQLADSAQAIDAAFARARAMGVCAVCCSGDVGSYGFKDPDDGSPIASVMFPAASPNVLAVGGTQFAADRPDPSSERVWNDDNRGSFQASGGGVSGGFVAPDWQRGRNVPSHGELDGPAWIYRSTPKAAADAFVGRGVPDVAAFANQIPGYLVRVGGVDIGAGGTSASTPMWAGLVARLCQALDDDLPWLSELIYHPAFAPAFRNITEGDNAIDGYDIASFSADNARRYRWSACAGLGVPDGTALLAVLMQARNAGVIGRYDAIEHARRAAAVQRDRAVEAAVDPSPQTR